MDRSVRQSLYPVRRGVHGPGVSVFGSPVRDMLTAFEKHTICIKTSRRVYTRRRVYTNVC